MEYVDGRTLHQIVQLAPRPIAERRVRLGLLMQEIGTEASIEVTEQEMQGALMQRLLDVGIATRRGIMLSHKEPAYADREVSVDEPQQ